MKPILSIVYMEFRTWKLYRNTLVSSENINLLLNLTARPNADTLPSRKFDVLFDPLLHPLCGSLYRNHRHQSQKLELVRLPLLLSLQRKKSKVSGLVDAFLISGFGKY